MPSTLEVQSLNHWTFREVPGLLKLIFFSDFKRKVEVALGPQKVSWVLGTLPAVLSGEVRCVPNLTEAPTGLGGFATWPGVQKFLSPCTRAQTGSGGFLFLFLSPLIFSYSTNLDQSFAVCLLYF